MHLKNFITGTEALAVNLVKLINFSLSIGAPRGRGGRGGGGPPGGRGGKK